MYMRELGNREWQQRKTKLLIPVILILILPLKVIPTNSQQTAETVQNIFTVSVFMRRKNDVNNVAV